MPDHNEYQDFQQATISRCPHDDENPYAMVNIHLIRDESISPECRWMLIYLLSNRDGWKIRVAQVAQHVHKHISKKRVYALFNEAMEAGYINREFKKEGNIRQSVTYYLSETPKFKKCFRLPHFGEVEGRDVENSHHKKEYRDPLDINLKDKKEHIVSEPAVRLTTLFIERLREMNPKILKPNIPEWQKVIERMIKLDKRTPEEIESVINFISEEHKNPKKEFTWSKAVMSPEKLRYHFASIWIQMTSKSPEKVKEEIQNNKFKMIKDNEEWTKQTVKRLSPMISNKNHIRLTVGANGVSVEIKDRIPFHIIVYSEVAYRQMFENFLKKAGVL